IDLTGNLSGTISGKDFGYTGIGINWAIEGSAQRIDSSEGKGVFAGLYSNGQKVTGGNINYKVKIGSGGRIVLTAARSGQSWGPGSFWRACAYTYDWVPGENPPEEKKDGKATINVGNVTNDPARRPLDGTFSGPMEIPHIRNSRLMEMHDM